jgi:two-component system sensor histidine kinase HydH
LKQAKATMLRKRSFIITIGLTLILLSLGHVLIFQNLSPHVVLEELYYIPIFLAALRFGLKGALLTYLFTSLLYLPFFFGQWSPTYLDLVDRILHMIFTGMFAFLAGYLIDQERRLQKQAEQDRSLNGIGQAVTAIVHDLKNPLITIIGYARRIREKKGDPVQAARTISESAENMQAIVRDVLDFAKPMQLTYGEEDVNVLVRQAVDMCIVRAKESGVTLAAEFSDQSMSVDVDPIQVQRALVNLINNAIEASDDGQRVRISVVPGKNFLDIVIRDNGAGMDRETMESMFTPFHTRKSGGTGLGMSIARKIVESHGGRISVSSRPGKGAAVTVKLPCTANADGEREM